MSKGTILVSAADRGFFPLLSDLLASARPLHFNVGVLDVGLADIQRAELRDQGVMVVVPDWDHDLSRFGVPHHFRALTARMHLPKYFPNYDIYLFIDADCWIQDTRAAEMLVLAGRDFGFAAIPELDRSYRCTIRSPAGLREISPFEGTAIQVAAAFGAEYEKTFVKFATVNAGVFCARHDSPIWTNWSDAFARSIRTQQETFYFYTDQAALNFVLRNNRIPFAALPARFNWLCCNAIPRLSFDGRIFVDPMPPFEPLGILHLAANTKDGEFDVYDLFGRKHRTTLRRRQNGSAAHDVRNKIQI